MTSVYNKSPHEVYFKMSFFLKNTISQDSPFCGATDILVFDFWCCLPYVSKPGWIPHLHVLSPACSDHFFDPFTCTCILDAIFCSFQRVDDSDKKFIIETQQIEGKCIPRFSSKGHVQSGK